MAMATQPLQLFQHLVLVLLAIAPMTTPQSILSPHVDGVPSPRSMVNFTLFEDKNYKCCATGCGTCQTFSLGVAQCMNHNFYRERVSSIDVHKGCLRIWESADCTGASEDLHTGSPCNHYYLERCPMKGKAEGVTWDNMMWSVSGCLFGTPMSTSSANCPTGTWVVQVRVKPSAKFGLELDCYAPGSLENNETIFAAEGVAMRRNVLTTCEQHEPMRGLGFYITDSVVMGYCNYDQHSEHPFGSLCGDTKQAVCGVNVEHHGGQLTGGGPVCCTLTSAFKIPSDSTPDSLVIFLLLPGILVAMIVATSLVTIACRRHRNFLDRLSRKEKYTFELGDAEKKWTKDGRERAQYFRYRKKEYEISPQSIIYGKKLGEGFFAKVYIGKVTNNGIVTDVAIKKCRDDVNIRIEDSGRILLTEVKLLQYINYERKHENVVALLHAVTDATVPLLILEHCTNGSLANFLEGTVRHKFCSQVVGVALDFQIKQTGYPEVGVDGKPSFYYTRDLITWMLQAACGMSYLHQEKNIIHGDLFTKNALISKDFVAKIGDFGISKRVLEGEGGKSYARMRPGDFKTPYEIKHLLPPETCLDRCKLTKGFDIWTFGTVMWEILSLGVPSIQNCKHSAAQLRRPEHTTSELDVLMRQCWHLDPARRISFEGPGGLVHNLEQIVGIGVEHPTKGEHPLPKSVSESGDLNGRPGDFHLGAVRLFSSQWHLQLQSNTSACEDFTRNEAKMNVLD